MNKKVIKKIINILLVVVFTLFIFWIILKDNKEEVLTLLRTVNRLWILCIIFFVMIHQIIIGGILTLFTRLSKPDYRLRDGVVNALVASFFHGVTPSASGGQFAQVYTYKKQGVPTTTVPNKVQSEYIYSYTFVIQY